MLHCGLLPLLADDLCVESAADVKAAQIRLFLIRNNRQIVSGTLNFVEIERNDVASVE